MNKRGFAPVIALLLVLVFAVGAGVTVFLVNNRNANYNPALRAKSNASEFAKNRATTPPGYGKDYNLGTVQRVDPVKGKSDLADVRNDLDGTNPDDLNADLDANDTDAASF